MKTRDILYAVIRLEECGEHFTRAFFYFPEAEFLFTPICPRTEIAHGRQRPFVFPRRASLCYVKKFYIPYTRSEIAPLLEDIRSFFKENHPEISVLKIEEPLYKELASLAAQIEGLTYQKTKKQFEYYQKLKKLQRHRSSVPEGAIQEPDFKGISEQIHSVLNKLYRASLSFRSKIVSGNLDVPFFGKVIQSSTDLEEYINGLVSTKPPSLFFSYPRLRRTLK